MTEKEQCSCSINIENVKFDITKTEKGVRIDLIPDCCPGDNDSDNSSNKSTQTCSC